MPVQKLKQFLDAKHVKYVTIRHSQAFTAQEVAASAHIPGRAMAKVVIVELDGEMAMAVLPSNRKVVLPDLQDITGSDRMRFVEEDKFKTRFPDCEIGAMPPFGNLYGMEVFVAESLAQNEAGETQAFVSGQVKAALAGFTAEQMADIVIAYEPIWAIGTGKAATAQQANDICGGVVRQSVGELLGDEAAATIRILYGGSTNDKNIREIMEQPDIDGALIGGAALKVEGYASMVQQTSEVYAAA